MKKISMVVTGDSLITMKQSVHSEPRFLEMVELIKDADLAFTNLEVLLHDYDGYPAAESGGTTSRADPKIIEELKWMGFDIVCTANNHSLDYMYGGLFKTIEHLDAAGVPYAGTGVNLAAARQPVYLEMPQGRVSLIAASSSFASFGRAGAARRDMQGRPGVNPQRFETYFVVKEETLEALKRVAEEIGLPEGVQPEDAYHFTRDFIRNKFVVGDDVGHHTKPHKGDMEGNLEAIRDAARQADWVLFSLHCHAGRMGDRERPAEFMEEFAKACIDAGTHAFIGHGHHAMRGIEIWEGKPIFYGLGDFIYQRNTFLKMPAEYYERYISDPYRGTPADAFDARQKAPTRFGSPAYKRFIDDEKIWVSVIPFMIYEGDKLTELKLHPVELGQQKPRSQRGRPMFVKPKLADRILKMISDLSKPYGTEISIDSGVGIVEL